MNKDTGGPAFPTPAHNLQNDGMTLRDYFAGKAMQEYCKEFHDDAHLAKVAYQIADAMIKVRGQE
jgi:hypothetical protein